MTANSRLKAHHVGCLTNNIESSLKTYSSVLGFSNHSQIYTIHEQNVKVCFLEIQSDFYLELVEPTGDNPALNKLLKSGNPYYHIGYLADHLDEEVAAMIGQGCYLVNIFLSEAFSGKKCAFLYTSEMQLIELIQK